VNRKTMKMSDTKSSPNVPSQMNFESLIEKITGRFINLVVAEIHEEINSAQKDFCDFFGFDRSVLWLFEEANSNNAMASCIYTTPGHESIEEGFPIAENLPWISTRIRKGQPLELSKVDTLPPDAQIDMDNLKEMKIKSLIVAPMCSGEKVMGGLSFCKISSENSWDESIFRRTQIITQIFANALCLRLKEEKNKELSRFEKLIFDLSARFINIPMSLLDEHIERTLEIICKELDIELSSLWQWSDSSPHYLTLTHVHTPPYGPEKPEEIKAEEAFPWVFERLLKGETLTIYTEEMPPEAETDKASREGFDIQSSVVLPLCSGEDQLIGAISFDAIRHKKEWYAPLVDRLTLVGQMFTNVLAKKRQELKLSENEKRLRMATQGGNIGLWVMDIASRHIWATQKTRDIFNFGQNEALNYDSFNDHILEEDRGMVGNSVQAAIDTKDAFEVEFRIDRTDGSTCWIKTRGKVYCDDYGQPKQLMGTTIDISNHKELEQQLVSKVNEIQALKQKLEQENTLLHHQIDSHFLDDEIISRSKKMNHVLSLVEQVALTDATVLIQGETGTGKELIARAIHRLSRRKDRPLVTINCASLPPSLVESELFGREKGAYTGALTKMIGRFELADKATLFLDEVGELPMEIQAKLLRVLEQEKFERLGSTRTIHVDVRIIAATNQDLEKMVDQGKFRKDLFFRLNVFPIHIPPLRERKDEIPPLTWAFVREFEKKMARRIDNIPDESMTALQAHHWSGNVRELRNIIERSLITSNSRTLNILPLQSSSNNNRAGDDTLEEIERRHILSVLEKTQWRISGPESASAALGLKRTTLQSKMKKLGIQRPINNRR